MNVGFLGLGTCSPWPSPPSALPTLTPPPPPRAPTWGWSDTTAV